MEGPHVRGELIEEMVDDLGEEETNVVLLSVFTGFGIDAHVEGEDRGVFRQAYGSKVYG